MLINNTLEYYLLLYRLKQYGQSIWSLVFLKTMNTDFLEIEIWFTDQNNKLL